MPEIVVKQGTTVVATHQLSGETIRIGRSRDNDIVLDHLSISRHHTELNREGKHWVVCDLNSANGTFVNGQKVTNVPLYHADTITIGKLHLHFFETAQHPPAVPEMHDNESTMVLGALPTVRACLSVTKGKNNGLEHIIEKDRTVIGRASDCDLQLSDWRISKYHAQVIRRGPDFIIEDLGTWGAIQINGAPTKQAKLTETDEIQLGGTRLSFRALPIEEIGKPRQAPIPVPVQEFHPEDADESAPETLEEQPRRTSGLEDTGPQAGGEAAAEEESEELVDIESEQEEEMVGQEPAEEETEEPLAAHSPTKGNGTNHGEEPSIPEGMENNREFQMWFRAYQTGGPAMRKHAARQLEKLTGQRYDT